jgi:hypothetical protein
MPESCFNASAEDFSCQDLRVLGAIYFALCILLLVPYLVVLKVIISNKIFVQHYSYKIMIHLGIMDIGQLLSYYVIHSFMLLTNSNFGFFISKVIVIEQRQNLGFFLGSKSLSTQGTEHIISKNKD